MALTTVTIAASRDLRNVVKTVVNLPDCLLLDQSSDEDSGIERVAESLIHLWYSAFVQPHTIDGIRDRVGPLISEEEWLKLEKITAAPKGLTYEEASRIRQKVTLAPERADYRDRWSFNEATPSARLVSQRFREDGLLLPFGHCRLGFTEPNPSRSVTFEMYCVNATELPKFLEAGGSARIEVSNIVDGAYLGIEKTLSHLCPLLQAPGSNPHATLICVFLNAVMEAAKGTGQDDIENFELLFQYLPITDPLSLVAPHSPDMLRICDARPLVRDVEKYFQMYRSRVGFEKISTKLKVKEKNQNTIFEPWPTQLKIKPGHGGAEEEFRILLGSHLSGMEQNGRGLNLWVDLSAEESER
ncbi:hypothetical protein SAPIO_CDS2349 [Scedosporium apiospermum]|uniref:DUF4470 domain-containing protein n=1 Tax=Pseudallescheria apiosperma TaxID=563466 RepID=A0A084GCA7_PSEDA|nr:uncharacterized protein SAPIO_CDS2349 [Scedosporium apiospermum]KEZ44969.1 hypothetical protein SAPIO_CDS2349 [Scedosporium apiospermum]